MQASRGQRRHHLIFYLEIRDRGSNEPLGFLSNITPDGMQVLSERPLAVGKSFELEIRSAAVPAASGRRRTPIPATMPPAFSSKTFRR